MSLQFQSFTGMGGPDAVNKFCQDFLFVELIHGFVRIGGLGVSWDYATVRYQRAWNA